VSGYQSIDIHCIVLSVKFDGGLSISVLRNKQLLKKMEWKVHIVKYKLRFFDFQSPLFEERTDLEKFHFFGAHFSCEQDGQPKFKFDTDSEVLFIYRLIPRKPDLFGRLAIFATTPIGRILRASWSVHGCIQHKCAGVWISVNRYALHCVACEIWRCVACEIWRCVVHLGSEK
jgi:hypothetical protein